MKLGNRNVSLVFIGSKKIQVFRYGAKLVWQAIRGCFGIGFWRGNKPWVGDEAWKG